MPFRPPQPHRKKGPGAIFTPLVLPDGERSPELKEHLRDYVLWMNNNLPGDAKNIKVPETEEEYMMVNPISYFRAQCWHSFGRPEMADVICHWIGDCGLALMRVDLKTQPPVEPLIITPP